MKTLKLLVFFLLFMQYKSFAQDRFEEIDACLTLIHQVNVSIKESQIETDAGKKNVSDFLLCFDNKYSNAAELGEYSNEVLFKLLENYPKLTLEIMSKNKNQISWKLICQEIANPIIVSEVNIISGISKKIEAISGYDNVKKDVLDALKQAIINISQ